MEKGVIRAETKRLNSSYLTQKLYGFQAKELCMGREIFA